MSERICPICGKKLPKDAYHTAVYCSDACKRKRKQQMYNERKEYLKAHGVCPKCGYGTPKKGHVHCQRCISNVTEDWTVRAEHRMSMNLCIKCGEPTTGTTKVCKTCIAKQKARNQELYDKCVADGICTICKRRKATEGMRTCEHCRARINHKRAA